MKDWRRKNQLIAALQNIKGQESRFPNVREQIEAELKKMSKR